MAIYKLYDVVVLSGGLTKLPKNYKENGIYKFLDYKNVYKKTPICNGNYTYLPTINIFDNDKRHYKSLKNRIVATWSSESNVDVFQCSFIDTDLPLVVNGFSKILKVNKSLVNPKWLTYYLNSSLEIQHFRKSIPYTTRCNMKIDYLKSIKIKCPDLDVQNQIISIIEPKENLFFKYSNIIDISNYENFIKTWSHLISIIEPFEKNVKYFDEKILKILSIGDEITTLFYDKQDFKIPLKNYITSINVGKTPSRQNNDYWINGEIKWINSGSLTNNICILKETENITFLAKTKNNLEISKIGSIFLSLIEPSINKISISSIPTTYNQSIVNLDSTNNGFLLFQLRNNIENVLKLVHGSAQKSINKTNLLTLLISPISNGKLWEIFLRLIILYAKIKYISEKIITKLIEFYINE